MHGIGITAEDIARHVVGDDPVGGHRERREHDHPSVHLGADPLAIDIAHQFGLRPREAMIAPEHGREVVVRHTTVVGGGRGQVRAEAGGHTADVAPGTTVAGVPARPLHPTR